MMDDIVVLASTRWKFWATGQCRVGPTSLFFDQHNPGSAGRLAEPLVQRGQRKLATPGNVERGRVIHRQTVCARDVQECRFVVVVIDLNLQFSDIGECRPGVCRVYSAAPLANNEGVTQLIPPNAGDHGTVRNGEPHRSVGNRTTFISQTPRQDNGIIEYDSGQSRCPLWTVPMSSATEVLLRQRRRRMTRRAACSARSRVSFSTGTRPGYRAAVACNG